jgi:hypothetical protein
VVPFAVPFDPDDGPRVDALPVAGVDDGAAAEGVPDVPAWGAGVALLGPLGPGAVPDGDVAVASDPVAEAVPDIPVVAELVPFIPAPGVVVPGTVVPEFVVPTAAEPLVVPAAPAPAAPPPPAPPPPPAANTLPAPARIKAVRHAATPTLLFFLLIANSLAA